MDAPKVSVIVPVFNCEPYIADCLRSITAQTEPDIEIIVVDDGSTDRSRSLVKQIADSDSRVVLHSQPHCGYAGATRNVGLRHARARFISFLDGDDLYHPNKIKKSLAAFDEYGIDILFHDYQCFPASAGAFGTFLQSTHFMRRAAACLENSQGNFYRCRPELYAFASIEFVPCHICSTMFRRELLTPSGPWFRENWRNGEDGDFWLRLLRSRKIGFMDETLSFYRLRTGSLSSDRVEHLVGAVHVHTENLKGGAVEFSREQTRTYTSKLAVLLAELGYEHFLNSRVRESRDAYWRSMRMRFRLATLVAYLKSFAPKALVRGYRRGVQRGGAQPE